MDDQQLRYQYLSKFDAAMQSLDQRFQVSLSPAGLPTYMAVEKVTILYMP